MPLARLHELRSQIEALLTQLRSIHAQALAISSQFPGWYAHHLKETASRHEAELNRLQEEFARKWSGLMVGVNTLNPYVAGTGIEWRISANERTRLSTLIRDGSDLPSTTIDADTPMMVIARSYHRAIKALHENLEAIRSENLKEIATARQEFERKQYELQRLRDASLEALETEHSKQVETIGVEIDKRKSSWEQKRDEESQEAARSYEKEISEAKAAMIVSLTQLNAEQEKALSHLAQEKDMALKALAAQKEELIGKLQRLRRSSLRLPLYQRPWTDANWQPFHPATTLPTDGRLRIGRQFVSTPVGKVEIPLMVPFLGDSHLWVDIDERNRDQFMKFIASLVLRLYTSTTPGNLSVLLFDPSELGTRFTEYTSLLPAQLFKVTNDPHELDDELRRLTKAAFDKQRGFGDRASQSGRSGNRAYNVILLNDFPRRIDNRLLDSLEEIANAGHLRGLHIIGLIGKERLQKDQERNPTLLGTQIAIHGQEIGFLRTARTDRASLTMPSGNTKGLQQRELRLDIPYNKEFPFRILEAIRSQYESPRDVPRGFLEHLPDKSEVGQESSSEALRTPIGVAVPNRSSLVNIEFDSEQSVHAFILGSTGRGKSTLLTELITGLAIRYSPAELALMLLDDKEGVEFERWRVLPHVKILKLGRDTNSALAVVEDLEKELKRRGDAFRNKRVRSISEYRHQYPSEPMPRILMIWDNAYQALQYEQELSDRVVSLLTSLAKDGRYTGIHLVLTTQDLQGIGANLQAFIRQCDIQINFNDDESYLEFGSSSYRRDTKLAKKGEAWCTGLRSEETTSPLHVRFFDLPKEAKNQLDDFIAKQMQRYPSPSPKILIPGRLASPDSDITFMKERLKATTGDQTIVWLGEPVRIADPVHVTLTDELASNILLVGEEELLSPLLALQVELLLSRLFDGAIRDVYIFGGQKLGGNTQKLLSRIPQSSNLRRHGYEDFLNLFNDLPSQGSRKSLFFLWNVESLLGIRRRSAGDDNFDAASMWDQLGEALQDGPKRGAHVLAWTPSVIGLSELFSGKSLSDLFAYRVTSQLDRDSIREITSETTFREFGDKRALLFQPNESPSLFVPYDSTRSIKEILEEGLAATGE